jgi:WD40 repeat protein
MASRFLPALLLVLVPQTAALRLAAQELVVIKDQKWAHRDAAYAGIHRLAFTADGATLLSAGYNCVRVWDMKSEPPRERSAAAGIKDIGRHGLWDATISADGRMVAAGGDRILIFYDVVDGQLKQRAVHKDQAGAVRSLAFSANGKWFASGSDDRTVYIYDVAGPKPVEHAVFRPEKAGSAMISLKFLADGKSLLFGYQGGKGNIGIEDISGKEPRTLGAFTDRSVHRVTISADGKMIALFRGNDIGIYDVAGAAFKERTTLKGHKRQGMGLSFSPDGALLASSGKDEKCIVWDVASGAKVLTKLYSGDVEDVAFAPATTPAGEYRLAVATHQRDIRLFTLKRN